MARGLLEHQTPGDGLAFVKDYVGRILAKKDDGDVKTILERWPNHWVVVVDYHN